MISDGARKPTPERLKAGEQQPPYPCRLAAYLRCDVYTCEAAEAQLFQRRLDSCLTGSPE